LPLLEDVLVLDGLGFADGDEDDEDEDEADADGDGDELGEWLGVAR
jgi:hypothetical protein